MDEISKQSAGSSGIDARRLIARLIVAVLLAEGIWALLVAITSGVIVPALARVMGGDPQSPLYLGKGDFNPAAVFIAVIELCFAGIVAAVVNYWAQRQVRPIQRRAAPVRIAAQAPATKTMTAPQSAPVSSPAPVPPAARVPESSGQLLPQTMLAPSTPSAPPAKPAATPAPAGMAQNKPQKPKTPKEVYYNIVGEPISPTEEDE